MNISIKTLQEDLKFKKTKKKHANYYINIVYVIKVQ